jgi:peptidoglycan/LPS O-acetylase OafA/YrhL
VPPNDRTARPQLRALTGLRFIAALQVVVFHCTGWRDWPVWAPLRDAAGAGYVAVSLFFVLSGFILTYAHGAAGAPDIDPRAFYANRFARIYPAYAFALLLSGPLFAGHSLRLFGAKTMLEQATAVVLLVQAYFPSMALAWNPPAWSLSVEAFFYLLFPFVAQRLTRCRWSIALAVAAASYAVCLLLPIAYLAIAPDAPVPPVFQSEAPWLNALRYDPVARFPEFVIGIVAGRWYLGMGAPREAARWSLPTAAALVVLVAALGGSSLISYPVLHNGLLAPVFALLIVGLASGGGGGFARLLATRPFVALGDASYSLYVLHIPLLILWAKATFNLAGGRFYGTPYYTLSFMILAVGASLLCHRFIERPGLAFTLAVLRGQRSLLRPASS